MYKMMLKANDKYLVVRNFVSYQMVRFIVLNLSDNLMTCYHSFFY